MRIPIFFGKLHLIYCTVFSLLLATAGFQVFFLPVPIFFIFAIFSELRQKKIELPKIFLYYNFVLTSIMTVAGFAGTRSTAELISALLFLPITIYFLKRIIPKRKQVLVIPLNNSLQEKKIAENVPVKLKKLDVDKRMFIKLIGSAGLSLFLLSIFTRKAHGAFFGSVPGPGTVALKDTTGTQIDPAKHHPTDGYKISQLDDSTPAYYGFSRSDEAWFILKEDSNGDYRYTKGSSSFSTNWTNRASLTYDYYHNVF